MNKHEAIRRVADELRSLGWTFVAARERVQCQHYAMQDQAATRRCPVDESCANVAMKLVDISDRREFWP